MLRVQSLERRGGREGVDSTFVGISNAVSNRAIEKIFDPPDEGNSRVNLGSKKKVEVIVAWEMGWASFSFTIGKEFTRYFIYDLKSVVVISIMEIRFYDSDPFW